MRARKGFTLIELLVVVAIIGILAALAPLLAFGSNGKFPVERWLAGHNAFAWVVPRTDFNGLPPKGGSLEKTFNAEFELRLASN